MKVAIVGSKDAYETDIIHLLPPNTTEIISGGIGKIADCAQETAKQLQLPLKKFMPDYTTFGDAAPLYRNDAIIEYADFLLIFWNGYSPATHYLIEQCKKLEKTHLILQAETYSVLLSLDNIENKE